MSNDLDWLFGSEAKPKPNVSGAKPDKGGAGKGIARVTQGATSAASGTGDIPEPTGEVHTAGPDRGQGGVQGGDGGGEGDKGGEESQRSDLEAAAEAFKSLNSNEIGSLLAGITKQEGVQRLRRESRPRQTSTIGGSKREQRWKDGADRSGPGLNIPDPEVAGQPGGLLVPMRVLPRDNGGADAPDELGELVEGHKESEQVKGSDTGEPQLEEADVPSMAVGLQGDTEAPGEETFFPRPTGEHARSVQEAVDDSPWEIRLSSSIEYKFPWAEGITEEQQENYGDQLKGVIPRMGAKSKLREWLIPRFPEHHTYIEPFGGSFKVLLWKSRRSRIEIINDLDADLIHFFRYLTFFPDELAEMVNCLPTHKGLLDALRDELRRGDLKGIERAAAVYYSIKLSFNGTGNGYAGSVQSLCSARADKSEFRRVAVRLRGVDIRSQDAHDLISSSNRRLDHSRYPGGIFYYLDPPYDETAGYSSLTSKSIYGKQEQYALFNLAKKIHEDGNKFLMTNSYTDYLRKMWGSVEDWHSVKRMVKYDISGSADDRKETAELIVSNFPLVEKAKKQQQGLF